MAFVVADRVQETCAAPGTGTVTLLGASNGYQSFSSGIGNGNVTFYTIADQAGANWEVGIGTYSSSGNTLSRTTILASSNGGSATNFSSGVQNVWCDYPAGRAAMIDSNGKLFVAGQGYVDFASASPAVAAGRMWYDGTTGSWNMGMGGGNITQQVGEEILIYGKASSAISGNTLVQAVYQTGVVGASGVIQFAPTVAGITSQALILGLATEDISTNNFGRITSFGVIHGVNASGSTYGQTWNNGDILWYDPVGGGVTNVKPSAPNIKVALGTVINNGGGGSGSVFAYLDRGSTLGGTDANVQFGTLATNNLIQYNGTYWTNVTPASVTGVGSVANALSAGTGLSGSSFDGSTARSWTLATAYGDSINPYASKTANYFLAAPNGSAGVPTFRAIVAADIPALSYVSSVAANSPVASSGGLTPTISLASGYGDTQNPYGSKTANYVLAAPDGSSGAPTFRALVAADIPSSYSQFAAGTTLLFYQAAAPTGWTQVTTINDTALRVVSGATGGTTGGTTAFSTVFANQTPTITVSISGVSVSATTLSTAQMPSHNHSVSDPGHNHTVTTYDGSGPANGFSRYNSSANASTGFNSLSAATTGISIGNNGSGTSHTHSLSGSATGSSSAITLNVKYANIILCSKN